MPSLAAAEKLFADAVDRHLAGDLSGAESRYRRVLGRFPAHVPSLLNFGIVLMAKGAAEQALTSFRRAVKAMPENADAHNNLGTALERLGCFDEAEAAYQRALELNPRQPDANNNLGNRLRARGRYLDAVEHYRAALAAEPKHIQALDNLGDALQSEGSLDEARAAYDRAEAMRPSFARRLKRGLMLQPIYASCAELEASREHFIAELAKLEAAPGRVADPLEELNRLPFYLAYQGFDNRELLERFAGLLRPSLPELVEPTIKPQGGRARRIGLVSAFWTSHSVSSCYLGYLPVLRAAGNELVAINLSTTSARPPVGREIADCLSLPRNLALARHAIADLRLDALIYFELGMDPMSYFLASTRLAPVQIALGGHPVTSGLPSVDYFVSSDLLEAPDADRFYTERLLRLSWFPGVWSRPEMPAERPDRAALGLPTSGALYVCPMMLFKLHSGFDRCLSGILDGDRDGHVILFEDRNSPQLGAALRRRFGATLGANASRVRFLPFLPHAEFMAVLGHATVALDTHPFGGATTLLYVISAGTPFVTRPTALTSGRTGAAFCKAIGVEELVTQDDDDYVRKALAVAADATLRARLSADIAERSAVLFDNTQGAQELAAFLERVCAGQNLATA